MIELSAIAKKYGDNTVLKSVDVIIPTGCVYGLVGKNGAGKTTLLNIIAGISSASAGQCAIDGEIIKKGYSLPGVSYLPDLPSFFDYLTVEEYLKFILKNHAKSLADYEDCFERFKLNKKAVIKTLSRGNRQKVGLLIATITSPRVLLLDEPTSALDPVGRKEVISIIKYLKKSGTTVIFSTHILSDMELVCDRIGFLQNGIIAREIDLKNVPAMDSYELSLRESVPHKDILDAFYGYSIEFKDDVIILYNINLTSLFDIITSHKFELEYLKRTSVANIEKIMMEVLGE